MIFRPSVCLTHHATAAATCGGFAAERRAYTISGDAALELKSDLFLQSLITAFLKGGGAAVVSLCRNFGRVGLPTVQNFSGLSGIS